MPRITCREPSTGRALLIAVANVTTAYQTIAEAPDFSVPDEQEEFEDRDPLDATRAIRPGEVFFLRPLAVRNKSTTLTRWVEVQIVTEAGVSVTSPGRISIPAGDTVYIPIQGLSLFKRAPAGSFGDRLQIRAEAANQLDVIGSAEEKLSAEHQGVGL